MLEGVEFILSEYSAQYDICSIDDEYGQTYPTLPFKGLCERAFALGIYPSSTHSQGANLHAPVYRDPKDMMEIGYLSEYGPPLDELLAWNRDHLAARAAVDG